MGIRVESSRIIWFRTSVYKKSITITVNKRDKEVTQKFSYFFNRK